MGIIGDPQNNSDILDRFKLLEKTGALADLALLRKENKELDQLINDASILMSQTQVSSMISFVISRLLDYCIPQFMAFLIEPPRGEELRQFCFRNLKASEERIADDDYALLKAYFEKSPYMASFASLNDALLGARIAAGSAVEGGSAFSAAFSAFAPELFYPMRGIGGLYGIAMLGAKVLGEPYSDHERLYVDRMTRFLAVGIQNGLHHESSITDAKTGLYNHEYFTRRLEDELARIRRHGGGAGLLMLDVDHFKHFNDRYGHMTGDDALYALAGLLKDLTRSEDTVSRFGGEEFSLLVMECDAAKIMDIAERIRAAVEALAVPSAEGPLHITISIGARVISAPLPGDAKQLIDEADKALYLSKAEGRNRATLYEPGLLWKAKALRIMRDHH
jgi:diguanylate cyclase (GGDEF)-like protein